MIILLLVIRLLLPLAILVLLYYLLEPLFRPRNTLALSPVTGGGDDRCRFDNSYRSVGIWSRSEADLLRICHGDKVQFERLVTYAQRRNPGISRQVAIEHAVYWYQRDNR